MALRLLANSVPGGYMIMSVYTTICLLVVFAVQAACSKDTLERNSLGPDQSEAEAAVIFESNFSEDTGYLVSSTNLWFGGDDSPIAPPKGWDGVKASNGSTISVEAGAGVDGSNALKMEWDPTGAQPTVSLAKHLTGDVSTGYDEVYIRYHVRLPNKFKIGTDGEGIEHWKWGRLYQNTNTDNSGTTNHWTENRANSGFVVWNFGGDIPYTDVNVYWAENSGPNLEGGSNGGPSQKIDYFRSEADPHTGLGYFENIWDINDSDRPGRLQDDKTQGWHTIEYRMKLATSAEARDGIFEMWWDGEYQGRYSRIVASGGAADATGIPTLRQGSGFNFFILFDNMQGWNAEWSRDDVDGFVYVNDVVVSTGRIGHGYVVQ